MLYDPKWEVETKADPLTLPAFIAWLEQQKPDARYRYGDNFNCAICQFLKYQGYTDPLVGGSFWLGSWSADGPHFDMPKVFDEIVEQQPRTFGAALDRARKLLAHAD